MIMESVVDNSGYSPHLKKVLKSYQTAAMNSLSGPSNYMSVWNSAVSSKLESLDHLEFKKGAGGGTSNVIIHPTRNNSETVLKKCYTASTDTSIINKNISSCSGAVTSTTTALMTTTTTTTVTTTTTSVAAAAAVTLTAASTTTTTSSSNTDSKFVDCDDPLLAPPPFPIQQVPILTAPDQSRSERTETILEGETISCFVVGGEKRLCLPQILNSVLRDFSLQQINTVCDELQIFCSRCTQEQLKVLKVTGILPFSAPSCGLITKTDAERLCNALLHSHPPRAVHEHPSSSSNNKRPFHFLVYHECFGKCKGLYTPDHYASPHARCIECTDCRGLFSPQKFVGHAHKALENRTCHWGFDSVKWRSYILLAKGQEGTEQLQSHLNEMKSRYDNLKSNKRKQPLSSTPQQRHQQQQQNDNEDKEIMVKKLKSEEPSSYYQYVYDPVLPYLYGAAQWSRMSAFRPWSPMVGKDGKINLPVASSYPSRESVPHPSYLSHGPPVLLNPERVVPISETERFERHYQPNVALAPPAAQISALQKATANTSSSHIVVHTSSSSLKKPLHLAVNPIPSTCNPEIELSTDTDETSDSATYNSTELSSLYCVNAKFQQSKTASSPDTSVVDKAATPDDIRQEMLMAVDVGAPDASREFERLKELLGKEGLDVAVQDKVLDHVSRLLRRLEKHLDSTVASKKALQQELEYAKASKKKRLRELLEAKRQLQMDVERMYEERNSSIRELEQLKRETEALRRVKKEQVGETCNVNATNERLRYKIDEMGDELNKLQQELLLMRRNGGNFSRKMAAAEAAAAIVTSPVKVSADGVYDYSGVGAAIVKQELMVDEEDENKEVECRASIAAND